MGEIKASMQKTKLAAAISAALSIVAGQASAQQASDVAIEEVVVTGIRGSLQAALDIKRESSGVVDAISAEDIGKFPDTNLAESLQRITGVSINRVEGEGSQVTIRGFSGDFNLVTLNGRLMPAADARAQQQAVNYNVNSADSRSFDFSNIASEGVSGLQVYKTGRAGAPSGGIGGTINVQTIRPLQAGDQLTFGAKAVSESGSDSVTPEMSGLGSWTNDEGTFGVAAFASYQEREYSIRNAVNGGIVWQNPYNSSIPAFANATVVNEPGPDDLAGFPQSGAVSYGEGSRERINGALTLEFAPNDRMTITADAMYAQTEQESWNVADLPYFVRQFDFVEFDSNPDVRLPLWVSEPLVAGAGSDFTQAGKELPFRNSLFSLRDELYSGGLNLDYKLTESLSLNVDVAHGKATAGGNNPSGAVNETVSIGGQAVAAQLMDYRSEIANGIQTIADGSGPTSTVVNGTLVNFAGGNANGIFEKSDLGSQWINRAFSDQETTLDQFSMKLAIDDGGPIRANFGLGYVGYESQKIGENYSNELGGWNTGYIGDIAALIGEDAIRTVCITCEFDDHDNQIISTEQLVADFTAAGGTIAPGASVRRMGEVAYFMDPIAFGEAFDGFTNGTGVVFDNANRRQTGYDNNVISEDSISIFGEVVMDGEAGGMPIEVVVGLRYEETDVESTSAQTIPTAKVWTSDNDFATLFSPGFDQLKQDFEYNNFLPSLDLSVDVTDNWKVRASFSTTIGRPNLNSMFLKTNAGSPTTLTYLGGIASGDRGNAQLEPLESDNFDLSVEYYYGEGSAVTVAYFDKKVSNFVGNEQVETTLFDLRDVSAGAPGTRSGDAIAALAALGWAATETNLFTMTAILDNPDDFPGGAADFIDPSQPGGAAQSSTVASNYDITPNADDPLMNFIVQQPTNAASADIDGWELNWVHFFDGALNGFGIQANATFVSGDIGYDFGAPPTQDQFALTGLSDSANLIVFYENDRFSARVLFNQRAEFMDNTNIGNRVPRVVDEYQQLDLSASFAVTDRLTFTLEGINMLEEPIVWRGRTDQQVQSYIEGDMRVLLGARYDFQ